MIARLARPLAAAALLALPLAAADAPDLPKVSARLLLSDYEPLGDREEREAELFYAALRATWEKKGWGARAELRADEGRFRDFYPGSVWLQEGYGYYVTPAGELRLGKLERAFGLPDDSFGGTLFSRNGVTRNPDWGAALVGERAFGQDTLSWAALYLGQNDRVSWEEPGFGVESDPHATLRDAFSGRATYRRAVEFPWLWVTPGLSGETARVARDDGRPAYRRSQLALDVTGAAGPISLGLQGYRRSGETDAARIGDADARAWGAAFTAEFPNVVWRYVYSEWWYPDLDSRERQHLASASWSPRKGIEGIVEYTGRRFRDAAGGRAYNAFRFGITLTF